MSGTYKGTVLVTGGTLGLGYETALVLAKKLPDHQIVIASRSNKDDAAAKINTATSQRNTIYLPLDLSSPKSIKTCASTLTTSYPKISHLVLNAGLQFAGLVSTFPYFDAQIEKTFAVNHLGHAHLFYLLLPHLTPDAHIVVVASGVHDPAQKTMVPDAKYISAEKVAQPDPKTAHKNGQQRYATSKICNILWTYALDRRIKANNKQFIANSFDPGLMFNTGLARDYPTVVRWVFHHVISLFAPLMRILMTPNIHTPSQSGAALARLTLGEEQGVKGVSGKYFEGMKPIKSSEVSYDEAKQDDLWEWTARFLAQGDEGLRERWEKLDGGL